jgi:hypothetical protein
MGLPCGAVMEIAFLKASEGDGRERVEQVKKVERLASHFERDVRSVTGEGDPSQYVKIVENSYPKVVTKVLEVKCDERSLAWVRFIFRQIWDNRESEDLLNLDFDSIYASQDAGESFEATLGVLKEMANEMNCVIGFNHYNYEDMKENQYYFRPGAAFLMVEDVGSMLICEGEDRDKSSFDLGFEWQLKIAIDEIKHKEWSHPTDARLENANEKTCSQSEETSDELPF